MKTLTWSKAPLLSALALALASPALAQSTGDADTRLRKVEAEVRALQRQVFPGGDGKFFPAQVQAGQSGSAATGTPAATPVSDLLARMDAVESQLARLTAQGEENSNKIAKLEALVAAQSAAGSSAAAENGTTTNSNLAAMTGGAASKPAASTPPALTASKPATTPAAKPATTPAAKPSAASAQRLAGVKAVQKPQTDDPGDDEYSYGYRLWDSKFFPEAQQQLKLFMQKYPKHSRMSYARNLLGRTYLDEGNSREAASWFLQNYQADKKGDRAPDSLLLLAEAMRQLKDTNRACVALAQFTDDYPKEAAGRLKAQFDVTRAAVKCN